MTAAMNTRDPYTAGMSCAARYASFCTSAWVNCVMGTAAAVSIFVVLHVRLCVLLQLVRKFMRRIDRAL